MKSPEKTHKKRKREEAQETLANGTNHALEPNNDTSSQHKKKKSKKHTVVENVELSQERGKKEVAKEEKKRKQKEKRNSEKAEKQAVEEVEEQIDDTNERLPEASQNSLKEEEDDKVRRRREKKLKKERLKAEKQAQAEEDNPTVELENEVVVDETIIPDSQEPNGATKSVKKKKQIEAVECAAQADDPDVIPSTDTPKAAAASDAVAPLPASQESPFVTRTSSFYVSLSPVSQKQPLAGVCAEHLSPLLLHYFAPLKGIMLSYSNPRLSTTPPTASSSKEVQIDEESAFAHAVAEYATPYVWLTAEFLVLSPQRGTRMEGYVNVQNETHIGLLCYNYFNAIIERRRLPQDWEFRHGSQKANNASEGFFVDGEGNQIDELLSFLVLDYESASFVRDKGGVVTIEGTMRDLEREDEAAGKTPANSSRKRVKSDIPGAVSKRKSDNT